MTNWNKRFMDLAKYIAEWSKYPGRHVGAVVVDDRRTVVSMGYNGCPRGCVDDDPSKYLSDTKYLYAEHAERNTIYNAARSLIGCTMYVMWFPCADCARAIIQSGITTIVVKKPDFDDPDWGKSFKAARQMLRESGVAICWYEEEAPKYRKLSGVYEGYVCIYANPCEGPDCDGCGCLRRIDSYDD
jgi:dCMP deaminase